MHRQRSHITEESGALATALDADAHVARVCGPASQIADHARRDLSVAIEQTQLPGFMERDVILRAICAARAFVEMGGVVIFAALDQVFGIGESGRARPVGMEAEIPGAVVIVQMGIDDDVDICRR